MVSTTGGKYQGRRVVGWGLDGGILCAEGDFPCQHRERREGYYAPEIFIQDLPQLQQQKHLQSLAWKSVIASPVLRDPSHSSVSGVVLVWRLHCVSEDWSCIWKQNQLMWLLFVRDRGENIYGCHICFAPSNSTPLPSALQRPSRVTIICQKTEERETKILIFHPPPSHFFPLPPPHLLLPTVKTLRVVPHLSYWVQMLSFRGVKEPQSKAEQGGTVLFLPPRNWEKRSPLSVCRTGDKRGCITFEENCSWFRCSFQFLLTCRRLVIG